MRVSQLGGGGRDVAVQYVSISSDDWMAGHQVWDLEILPCTLRFTSAPVSVASLRSFAHPEVGREKQHYAFEYLTTI